MAAIKVIYWTGTGNTEEMAGYVAEGIREGGKDADVLLVSDVTAEAVKDETVFALGCPAMGDEELEDSEMEPFFAEVEGFAAGKYIGLFGSYSWNDGKWMEIWADRAKAAGATVVGDSGVIAYDAPDAEAAEACRALGRALAAL